MQGDPGERRVTAGYSGTPLVKKLGVKRGMVCAIIDPPEHYWQLLIDPPEDMMLVPPTTTGLDFVHLFVTGAEGLHQTLDTLRGRIAQSGMIWVSWPKRASRIPTTVTEDVVRAAALLAGLVDIKVCAVDEVWSGLKLVIPKADRR